MTKKKRLALARAAQKAAREHRARAEAEDKAAHWGERHYLTRQTTHQNKGEKQP